MMEQGIELRHFHYFWVLSQCYQVGSRKQQRDILFPKTWRCDVLLLPLSTEEATTVMIANARSIQAHEPSAGAGDLQGHVADRFPRYPIHWMRLK